MRLPRGERLRHRLLFVGVLLALLGIVPLGLVAYTTTVVAQDSLREEVEARLRTTASVSGKVITQQVGGVEALVEAYARRAPLVEAVGGTGPQGFDVAAIGRHLDDFKLVRGDLAGVFVTDLDGRLVKAAPDTPGIVGRSFAYRDWYRGLVATGETYLSEAYESALSGRPLAVGIATYVRTPAGRPVAILVAIVDVSVVQGYGDDVAAAQGVQLSVTDQRGTMLAGPALRPGILGRSQDPLVAEALAGRSGVTRRDAEGRDVLVAYAPVPALGWSVLAEVPRGDALQGTDRIRSEVLVLVALLLVCGAFVMVLLLRSEAKRIRAERLVAEARDTAVEASRLKSEFLAVVSHELRTPLNGVIGMTDLLLDTDLDAAQRDLAQTAHRCGETLLAVISDILDFSKIEADRLDLESIDFDLGQLVDDALRLLAPAAQERGIELGSDVDDVAGFVARGDPTRVRQVLLNLVSNAVKFTETGGVEVRVTVADPGPPAVVRLDVSDTGIGISPEAQRTLFEPFVQADASTTRRFGGTGLGLAICQRFVTRMGGEIGLSSSPRGSTFWFTLPLGAPAPAIDVTGQASARLGARVLVADDDPVNQRVASLHLERLGYEVDTVPDGAAAVRAVAVAEAVRPYDAVLMDCHMPGIDGYESTRRIRRNEAAGRHVPIIALTASTTDTDRCMALEAGMDDHLVKPVRASALEGALARWVVVAVETRDGDRAVEPDAAARPVAAEADADEADAEGQAALDGIVALAAGQPGLIEELLSTLRTEAAQRLTALRTAVSRSDVDSVAENAHRLRGTAANIGATRVVACARALETAAARGDFMTAAVVLEVLPGLLDEAEARLRSALGSPVA